MNREYINSQDSTPRGLGVVVPAEEQTLLDGGSRVEPSASREHDDMQSESVDKEEASSCWIPGPGPQPTLTKTMLDTYALMRGRLGRGERGPLYREDFAYKPWQPRPDDVDRKLSPTIPWETFDHEDKESKKPNEAPTPDLNGARLPRQRTFSEKLGQIGYVKINGKFTDPDSKVDVLNALNGIPGSTPRVPGFHDPLLSNVMTNTELEAYYEHFLLDVDNEEDPERDNEGNPLDTRISPEIFKNWAAGARKKDRLDTAEIAKDVVERARQEELKGAKPPGNPKPLKWSSLKMQYDEESGGAISPAYSVEEHPSPLLSPRGKAGGLLGGTSIWTNITDIDAGVNLGNVPRMFYHMLPEYNVMLARAAFHDGGIDLSPKASSETEIITDWQLADDLGDGNRQLGMHRIDVFKMECSALMAERDVEMGKATEMMLQFTSARDTVTRLEEMIFARRYEMSIPKRRARANQLLGELKEYIRQQTARAADMTRTWAAGLDAVRDVNAKLVAELQQLDQNSEKDEKKAET